MKKFILIGLIIGIALDVLINSSASCTTSFCKRFDLQYMLEPPFWVHLLIVGVIVLVSLIFYLIYKIYKKIKTKSLP